MLDDAAYAGSHLDLIESLDGLQTVRTHTILLDPREEIGDLAERVFSSSADVGGGLYVRADDPGDVQVALSTVLSDTLQSSLRITSTFNLATPHRLFRGWTEVPPAEDGVGDPLYRGHLEAFQLVANPDDDRYGAIAEEPLWDAGELLAQRVALSGGENSRKYQEGNAAQDERTLWTNPAQAGTFRPKAMVALDSSSVNRLGSLLFENFGVDYTSDPDWGCPGYPAHDLNQDCRVDDDDTRMVIDFLRGVPEVGFGDGNVVASRGDWKLGGALLAQPAYMASQPRIISDDPSFVNFLARVRDLDPVIYLPSNDGFLHAFKAPYLDSSGDGWEEPIEDVEGGWELWGFMPRHLLDHASAYHRDSHRALELMLSGERYLNDGAVNTSYVWMDGVPNLVDDDCRDADADGQRDADGCEMHRVLVVSMGLASRYHYANDVSIRF